MLLSAPPHGRGPARGRFPLRLTAAVLFAGALALLAACDSGNTGAGRTPPPSAASHPSLTLHRIGDPDVLLRGHGGAQFTFLPVADQKSYSWRWQVATAGGLVVDSGAGQAAGGARGIVAWDGSMTGGGQADPGLYHISVQVQDSSGAQGKLKVLGRVRFQPSVTTQVFSSLPKAGNEVALTFDGGSGHAWRYIMLQLESVHAKGAFFPTGVSVSHYPHIARMAFNLGETIGSHSYDHPLFTSVSPAKMAFQLNTFDQILWQAARTVGYPYFRPPYGGWNQAVLKVAGSLGYSRIVLWDVDTGDWTGEAPAVVAQKAVSGARPGSIILMHTDWNAEKAIPAIVRGLRAKGLEPVTLDKLFRDAGYK
jgi:peptidoglycan/xylan/chitin deacetylase (PgdA/CDA1 family)